MKWNKETDVVVVGCGLAGAVAAVEARTAGAEVIILEKSQYPGGCSILSGGMVVCADDVDQATQYLTWTSGGRVEPDVISAFAREMAANEPHLRKLAEANGAKVMALAKEDKNSISPGSYPMPGGDAFYRIKVAEVPGFKGFDWVQTLSPLAGNLMKVAFDNINKRNVEQLLSTPARRLVTEGDTVVGLVAVTGGQEINIRARQGVILACGGFEQNPWLLKQYLQGQPFYSMAPMTHTGDGVIMAQKAGAALWHMWLIHGAYGFKFPEFPIAIRHSVPGRRNLKRIMPWIVVDKSGRRYMNEYPFGPQDSPYRPMEIYEPDIPGYPRIPSYMIFDETCRKRGPIADPLAIGEHFYEWSRDNLKEVARGWIIKADSASELANKIRAAAENEALMEADVLEATISDWNRAVQKGHDLLRRPPGTMMLLKEPPFYAVPVWPVITNTQGGPQHDVRQRVIDAFGQPIPRLYSAGELGSFWSHLYLLGGNLSECLSSGRVAGRNAAAEPAS